MVGGWWRAGLALLLLGLNTLICCSVLFALALLRLLLPLAAVRRLLDPLINGVASTLVTMCGVSPRDASCLRSAAFTQVWCGGLKRPAEMR